MLSIDTSYGNEAPFLELIHSDVAGHLKFAKCVPHIMQRAWWLFWKRDLNLFIMLPEM